MASQNAERMTAKGWGMVEGGEIEQKRKSLHGMDSSVVIVRVEEYKVTKW